MSNSNENSTKNNENAPSLPFSEGSRLVNITPPTKPPKK